jgi:FtsZ-binding cell division protein ZapB
MYKISDEDKKLIFNYLYRDNEDKIVQLIAIIEQLQNEVRELKYRNAVFADHSEDATIKLTEAEEKLTETRNRVKRLKAVNKEQLNKLREYRRTMGNPVKYVYWFAKKAVSKAKRGVFK